MFGPDSGDKDDDGDDDDEDEEQEDAVAAATWARSLSLSPYLPLTRSIYNCLSIYLKPMAAADSRETRRERWLRDNR